MEPEYDLLIVADATCSMTHYLASLNHSLPQILSISALTGCFSRIGLLAYRDYCDDDLLEWSGWLDPSSDSDADQPDLIAKAKSLEPEGGGDYPEAVKTALAKAYQVMRPEAKTIMFIYTDAPPHSARVSDPYSNAYLEARLLSIPESFDGFGSKFLDWVSACKQLHDGEKKAQVFCILENEMARRSVAYYNYISAMTGGACIYLRDSKPADISSVTMALLLAWMGAEKADAPGQEKERVFPAALSRYMSIEKMRQVKDESDQNQIPFFAPPTCKRGDMQQIKSNIVSTAMTDSSLKKFLPKKKTPVADFAQSWTKDPAYQALVVKHLGKIINDDVSAITLNPVFGTLWRAICNDRKHEARDGLVDAFSFQIGKITNAEERGRLTTWLEESYDCTAEIIETIHSVPETERFPCVFLDPTLSFVQTDSDPNDDEDDSNLPITAFTRAELLEIGRSCDPRILRRLGRVLTRLTYVESAADMPEHIAATSDNDIPKIPMVLASNKFGNKFWNILLHTIVPGTLLSARPGALLAALSLHLGIAPLTQAADREMLSFRNNWNNVEVPENWNVSCLTLLLNANRSHSQRQQRLKAESNAMDVSTAPLSLLKESDRTLFENLCTFKMLELNLDSTLMARVGWTPEKTVVPIGPVATCRSCKRSRSVTVMGPKHRCGLCLTLDSESVEKLDKRLPPLASEDNKPVQATWVECCVRTCRAQYVVYDVDGLNVRPKCHYCRQQGSNPAAKRQEGPAPWVECKECLNRVIWPEEYRPSSFVKSDFICQPCCSGRETTVDIESTAKKISAENSRSWLIHNTKDPDADPFTNRSLYQTVSTAGTDIFLSSIRFFPPTKNPLTLKGKPIHNSAALVSTLQDRISHRQTGRTHCSLCFSTFRLSAVNPACGRRGCFQRICTDCLSGWYGLNAAGRIINTAALSCPFCRRFPTSKILAKYGMRINGVKDLTNAIRDKGTWIYAWCQDCHSAKEYAERVCAHGMPAEIQNWTCDDCGEDQEQQRLEEERRLAEQALADAEAARDAQALEHAQAARRRIDATMEAYRLSKVKACPGCGTMTQKTSGCGHITCPVKGCGAHWCYFCGERRTPGTIYAHIESMHGGLYDEDLDDEDEDEADDEFYD